MRFNLAGNVLHAALQVSGPRAHEAAVHAQVVGFDMVDDESKPERRPAKHMQGPRAWDLKHNPAYAYYAYYTYANLFTLNKLREARGLNTFALRPHAGVLPRALPLHKVCIAHAKKWYGGGRHASWDDNLLSMLHALCAVGVSSRCT